MGQIDHFSSRFVRFKLSRLFHAKSSCNKIKHSWKKFLPERDRHHRSWVVQQVDLRFATRQEVGGVRLQAVVGQQNVLRLPRHPGGVQRVEGEEGHQILHEEGNKQKRMYGPSFCV